MSENHYLQRRTTHQDKTRNAMTISAWVKLNGDPIARGANMNIFGTGGDRFALRFENNSKIKWGDFTAGSTNKFNLVTSNVFNDLSQWYHIIGVVRTAEGSGPFKTSIYVNGVRQHNLDTFTYNYSTSNLLGFGAGGGMYYYLFARGTNSSDPAVASQFLSGAMSDVFIVSDQCLEPETFGFFKEGKGGVGIGKSDNNQTSRGQWMPKPPKIIIDEIKRKGGFGVNGGYYPLNDFNDFGADHHMVPDTILKLNTDLSQPKTGIAATTAGAGIGFTDIIRAGVNTVADSYLNLAIPGIHGGLGSGYGDYSHVFRGEGTPLTVTASGNAGIAFTECFYGSTMNFDGSGDYMQIADNAALELGSNDYTVEFWAKGFGSNSNKEVVNKGFPFQIYITSGGEWAFAASTGASSGSYWVNNPFGKYVADQWSHIAVEREGTITRAYLNGVCGTGITNSQSIGNGSQAFTLGDYADDLGNYTYTGCIADVRVYNGIAKYKGGFDVPHPLCAKGGGASGISTVRITPQVATNVFATFNELDFDQGAGRPSVNEGGFRLEGNSSDRHIRSTIGVTSTSGVNGGSKWYWEMYCGAGGVTPNFHHGISQGTSVENFEFAQNSNNSYNGGVANTWGYWPNTSGTDTAYWRNGGSNVYTDLPRIASGQILQFALDAAAGKIWVGINNSWFKSGNPSTGANALSSNIDVHLRNPVFPHFMPYDNGGIYMNFGNNPTFNNSASNGAFASDANGKGQFFYAPPTDFLALCTDNLAAPIENPKKYVKVLNYRGSSSNDDEGARKDGWGFQPDLGWLKPRNFVDQWIVFDSVQSINRYLYMNSTNIQYNELNDRVHAFNDDGFDVGTWNNVNDNNDLFSGFAWTTHGKHVPSKEYKIRVVADGGNKYRWRNSIDTVTFAQNAVKLRIAAGGLYTIDVSDSSVDGHPFKFSETSNGIHGGGSSYNTGVTYLLDGVSVSESTYHNTSNFNAATTRKIQIQTASAKTLYYYCHIHSGMGGEIDVNALSGNSNFDGAIQSTVSVNDTSGLSLVTYSGSGSDSTAGHGLGVHPDWIIWKALDDTFNWDTYFKTVGYQKTLIINSSNGSRNVLQQNPDDLTLPVKDNYTGGSESGKRVLAWCWKEVEGYSKFNQWIGNGNSNGPFVYCGFKPQMVFIKNQSGNGNSWQIHTNTLTPGQQNPNQDFLRFDSTGGQKFGTTNRIDFLSNGFKVRNTNTDYNQDSERFVFAAFAEAPLKFVNGC